MTKPNKIALKVLIILYAMICLYEIGVLVLQIFHRTENLENLPKYLALILLVNAFGGAMIYGVVYFIINLITHRAKTWQGIMAIVLILPFIGMLYEKVKSSQKEATMSNLLSFVPLLVLIVLVSFFFIIRSMKKAKGSSSTEFICRNCGSTGKAKRATKGSFWIELVLWLCVILPGLIYSIWRLTTRHFVCQACGSPDLIPVDSPRGKKLVEEFSKNQ